MAVPHADSIVQLGRADVVVTRIGLGLAPVARLPGSEGDRLAHETIDRAWDLGLRLYDTAPRYGFGASERRAGDALRSRPRTEFVLSTKVGWLLRAGREVSTSGEMTATAVADFSYRGTMQSFEESLARLGLDRIDILHIHDPDDHFRAARQGSLKALAELRGKGAIGAVGAGMNQAPMLARFVRTGHFDAILLAGRYSLLDQSGLDELLPLCHQLGVGVIVAGIFNSGVLVKMHPGASYDYQPVSSSRLEQARAIEAICRRHDVPIAAAAIQLPFGHPAVRSVVVGARTPEQLAESMAMFAWSVPGGLWRDLKSAGLLAERVPTP
jgi:aryl-alcohol dehydrogenase-like predicted oxidoreductase